MHISLTLTFLTYPRNQFRVRIVCIQSFHNGWMRDSNLKTIFGIMVIFCFPLRTYCENRVLRLCWKILVPLLMTSFCLSRSYALPPPFVTSLMNVSSDFTCFRLPEVHLLWSRTHFYISRFNIFSNQNSARVRDTKIIRKTHDQGVNPMK